MKSGEVRPGWAERVKNAACGAVFVGLSAAGALCFAAAPGRCADTAPEQIIVTGAALQTRPAQATQQSISRDDILQTRGTALSDALKLAPAASIQTNSRGETLVFLRNTGERQVAIFYDGAALNVPWDNRLDLALIPSDALGGMTVTKGPVSVLYGANSSGGAIEVLPLRAGDENGSFSARLTGGESGLFDVGVTASDGDGFMSVTAATGYVQRSGEPLSAQADLPFSQTDSDERTNTDLERFNGMLRMSRDTGSDSALALSLLYVDASFGIAPESDRDPATASVRFWRYPESRHFVGVLHGGWYPGPAWDLTASLWVQRFDQTIESYAGADYEILSDRQEDRNLTIGGRVMAVRKSGNTTVRGVVNGLISTHRQTDSALEAVPQTDKSTFRQQLLGGGVEIEHAVLEEVELLLGAGFDWLNPVETGGRPETGPFGAVNIIGGLRWFASDTWTLRASAGVKDRLPTMRELFGTAIDRFLINPDLRSERAILVEAAAGYAGHRVEFEIVPFASLVTDTIDQRTVTVDGRRLRQRINLEGSRVYGVEASGRARLSETLSMTGHATWTRTRRKEGTEPGARLIAERPNLIARLDLRYALPSGFWATAEIGHRGTAFSPDESGAFVRLEPSTQLNAEIGYAFNLGTSQAQVFLRADNLTDTLVLPQAGLPAAGRWLRGGLSLTL